MENGTGRATHLNSTSVRRRSSSKAKFGEKKSTQKKIQSKPLAGEENSRACWFWPRRTAAVNTCAVVPACKGINRIKRKRTPCSRRVGGIRRPPGAGSALMKLALSERIYPPDYCDFTPLRWGEPSTQEQSDSSCGVQGPTGPRAGQTFGPSTNETGIDGFDGFEGIFQASDAALDDHKRIVCSRCIEEEEGRTAIKLQPVKYIRA